MAILKNIIYIIGLTSLISACSSSGGGGGSGPAEITAANAQDLSIAATESAKQSVTAQDANFLLGKSSSDTSNLISSKVRAIALEAQSLGEICPGGGSYDDNIASGNGSGSITFNNCDIGDGLVINGTVSFSSSNNGNTFTITYTNVTVSGFGQTETLNATVTCTTTETTFTCNTTASITGIDGRTYSVSDVSVSGDDSSGYNVSATVVDPTHGTITINATAVLFDCGSPNQGRPSSGSITFSSAGKSGSVIFDSCSSYTVTVDGVANTFNW